ncbi:unnamed protein product, partial [Adineta steineri]
GGGGGGGLNGISFA